MARPLRLEFPGAIYHVTSRGNARKSIFKDDEDRQKFLAILHQVNTRYHWLCHAYCLMNNHYHLIIETPDGNLARGMRQLNGVYTQTYHRRHRSVGHIFQGRYKAILIQKESYLLAVCRYVVLNPVRAQVIANPEDWRWSSYRGTVGGTSPHPCLTTDWVLQQFGTRRSQAAKRYEDFVRAGIAQPSIWSQVVGQSLLGDEEFIRRIARRLKGHETIREIPRNQRYLARPHLARLFKKSGAADKHRRDITIVRAVMDYGYSQKEVADHLGLHYSTISRLLNTSP